LVPLMIIGVILVHLILLHEYVSSSSVRVNIVIIEFSSLLNKDMQLWIMWFMILGLLMFVPQYFMDADNWREANFLVTPDHIKPEWYFLFAYAILRCIPNKTIGVLRLVRSLVVVLVLAFGNKMMSVVSVMFSFIILTWLGGLEVTSYFTSASQYSSLFYFRSMI
jgi:ubiquinol-cytochrome c reductase cytochrome b subunit